jgi:hypothetical protein
MEDLRNEFQTGARHKKEKRFYGHCGAKPAKAAEL